MDTIKIGTTTKGQRVWIQGLTALGWPIGTRYKTHYVNGAIVLVQSTEGNRRVSKGKGGIIDLVGKRVTQWAQGATSATVVYTHSIIEIEVAG